MLIVFLPGVAVTADLPLDRISLPFLAQSGPGPTVWRNPAVLARSSGKRVWAMTMLMGGDDEPAVWTGGATVSLGFGIPLFCTDEIQSVARNVGVDPALAAALVAAESGFDPRAVSVTGARGLTQLTARTARSLGVYNRHWPRWNLWGGLHYLSQQLHRFGDEELALAAYTAGPTKVARTGKTILSDPVVSHYVSKIQKLRRAYTTRFPNKCVQGSQGLGIGFALLDSTEIYTAGWGIDLQAFMEIGLGFTYTDYGDSAYSDPMLASRIYVIDPVFLAGNYHWRSGAWSLGLLTSLRGESVQVGAEIDNRTKVHIGAAAALPWGLGIGARWLDGTFGFSASLLSRSWHVRYVHGRHERDSDSTVETTHTVAISIGPVPAL